MDTAQSALAAAGPLDAAGLVSALGRSLPDPASAPWSTIGGNVATNAGGRCCLKFGLLKRDGMRRELDPGALAMQQAVRRALDPLNLFNPGKG